MPIAVSDEPVVGHVHPRLHAAAGEADRPIGHRRGLHRDVQRVPVGQVAWGVPMYAAAPPGLRAAVDSVGGVAFDAVIGRGDAEGVAVDVEVRGGVVDRVRLGGDALVEHADGQALFALSVGIVVEVVSGDHPGLARRVVRQSGIGAASKAKQRREQESDHLLSWTMTLVPSEVTTSTQPSGTAPRDWMPRKARGAKSYGMVPVAS